MKSDKEQNNHIALFKGKAIRKTLHNKEWWFSVVDVVGVLTDSPQPKTYWAKMKERDKNMSQPFPFWEQLKMHESIKGTGYFKMQRGCLAEAC